MHTSIDTKAHNIRTILPLWAISWGIVAFGQPSFSPFLCPIAATCGWAIAFVLLSTISSKIKRFWAGTLFFFAVQLVQLSWFTSHPYLYIFAVWIALSFVMGVQFGILSLLLTKETFFSWRKLLAIPSLWMLLEWSRTFWLSGFSFNPTGLALAWPTASLQMASLIGILGLSFLVFFVNCICARAWLQKNEESISLSWKLPLIIALIPYFVGSIIFFTQKIQKEHYDKEHPPLQVAIVYSSILPQELQKCTNNAKNPVDSAYSSWKRIITALSKVKKEKIDFIVLPEICVPFSSESPLFPRNEVKWLFWQELSNPVPEKNNSHYKSLFRAGHVSFSSASIAQGIANTFDCPVIAGFEGVDAVPGQEKLSYFNSAFFFTPYTRKGTEQQIRYDKQILVPMGEYIPFSFAKNLAAQYGVFDSFTHGKGVTLFSFDDHIIGPSICYEEIFCGLMRKNRNAGATLFVNLTDDYWYPHSTLAKEHFEHARPRTVENGIPLIRSCNFGISGVIDALGETVVAEKGDHIPLAMVAPVSTYHYTTLYSRAGDTPFLIASFLILASLFLPIRKKV